MTTTPATDRSSTPSRPIRPPAGTRAGGAAARAVAEAGGSKTVADTPHDWLAQHGDALHAYAMARVRAPEIAEDLVQETLLAAIEAPFAGRSTRRTWLIGILRHRLLDHVRRRRRSAATSLDDLRDGLEEAVAGTFDARGKWADRPKRWAAEAGGDESVREALLACIGRLPPRTAEAFLLVSRHGTPVPAVAELLGTTPANVHQMMHRARLALRACLESAPAPGPDVPC